MAINVKGVRDNGNGTVTIQRAARSEQLAAIADAMEAVFEGGAVLLTDKQARQFWGAAQTIGIIAKELKSVGK